MFRIVEAASGGILVDNINVAVFGLDDLRSRLTIIPQVSLYTTWKTFHESKLHFSGTGLHTRVYDCLDRPLSYSKLNFCKTKQNKKQTQTNTSQNKNRTKNKHKQTLHRTKTEQKTNTNKHFTELRMEKYKQHFFCN